MIHFTMRQTRSPNHWGAKNENEDLVLLLQNRMAKLEHEIQEMKVKIHLPQLRPVTLENAKRKNESPGHSPSRRTGTPENIHHPTIYKLPELPVSGMDRHGRWTNADAINVQLYGRHTHDKGYTQIRPQDMAYMERRRSCVAGRIKRGDRSDRGH